MTTQRIDEILEIIFTLNEEGKNDIESIRNLIKQQSYPDILHDMKEKGIIDIKENKVFLTEEGKKRAGDLIRRHRLAERLLIDVLETGDEAIEESACKFEHILSDEVSDKICTLLGHPRECPHGLLIPAGKCCAESKRVVESVITPIDMVDVGEEVTVAYILTQNHPRLHKLMSFGISPGIKIKVHQKFPSFVIQVRETQIALEREVIGDIFVRH